MALPTAPSSSRVRDRAADVGRGVLVAGSPHEEIIERAGGKGINLHRLTAAGMPVPPWAIIGSDILRAFREHNAIDLPISRAISRLTPDTADDIASEVAELLASGDCHEMILDAIRSAYEAVDADAVAVRSSAADEDGRAASFAGQYATFLNAKGLEQVTGRVRDCWASAYSARSLRYRLMHRLTVDAIDMAVIVQAMVQAQKSGVMFTVNPVSFRADEILISAAYGLGEGIVDGSVDSDSVVVERGSATIKHIVLGSKDQVVEPAASGGVSTAKVKYEARAARSISDQEVNDLVVYARSIEELFGCPQDIEWAIDVSGVAVLQSRSITTPVNSAPGEQRIWDNSNIIESYGEVTAPLTYSFARWAYLCVFRDHTKIIGVPRRDLHDLEAWLPNMLGYFNGRVYYNLLNWYRLVGLLPFYGPHRKILEVSLGISESIDDEAARQLRPLQRDGRLAQLLVRGRIALRFAWHFATIELSVKRFLKHFYGMYAEFEPIDYSTLTAEQIYAYYRKAEAGLLTRWGRMVTLEAILGLSFGAMHTLTTRWLPDAPESLVWEMAKLDGDVESAQPIQRLQEIAQMIRADQQLTDLLEQLPLGREYIGLRSAQGGKADALRSEIDCYLQDFGYRNANELKLEEPDLREEPAMFFEMLRPVLNQVDLDMRLAERAAAGESADDYLRERLHGPKRWVYMLVRRRVRRALRARESVRFCRTRTFGVARRMFRAIGEDMARFGALQSARDIFYLRLEELLGALNGTIAHRELQPLVALRRDLEKEYRSQEAPARFTTSGTVYWGGLDREWASQVNFDGDWDGAELRGVPCGPGIAEGAARVVDAPVDSEGGILVTYRTDPGWTPALASTKGLVIERGSPLTHVAVVARELGIPTVIQVPGVTKRVRNGDHIRVDGSAGTVTIQHSDTTHAENT